MGCRQPSVTGKVTDSRGLDSYEIRVNSAGLWGRGNISTVLLLFRQQSRLRAAAAHSHKVRTPPQDPHAPPPLLPPFVLLGKTLVPIVKGIR